MKKLCLFLFLSLLVFPALTQIRKGHVYLKNGTILKGKFQYSEDKEKLQVESAGNLWVFDTAEIDTLIIQDAYRYRDYNDKIADSRFFFRTEIGLLVGNADNSQSAPFSFTSSVNYSITKQFFVGAGTGIEFLKESYLPVFLNLEYKLRDSYSSPYFFIKAGYQVPLEESREVYYDDYYPVWSSFQPWPRQTPESLDARGGLLINPGIGYQRMFSHGFGMSFAFGYQFHRLHYTGENDYGLDIDYNRLTIKLGIIFN